MQNMCNCRIQLWDMSVFSTKKFKCSYVCSTIISSCLIHPDILGNVKLYRKNAPYFQILQFEGLSFNWIFSRWSALKESDRVLYSYLVAYNGAVSSQKLNKPPFGAFSACFGMVFWEVLGPGWAWLFPGPRKWTQNCNGDMLEMCLFWIYLFLSFVLCPVRQFGHGRRNRMSCQDAFQLQPPSLGVAVPRHTSEVLHFCCPKAFQKWLVGTPVLNILFHMLYKMVYWYNVDTHRLLWCLHKLAHETWTFAFFVARFGRAFLLTEEVG